MAKKLAAKKTGRKTTQTAKSRRTSDAPDAYRGFAFQATRFLVHLLRCGPEDVVSLEFIDDVYVKRPGGGTAEQQKEFYSRNALANREPAFWSAFANWADSVRAGRIDPCCTDFVLCAPGAKPGQIADQFHAAVTDAQAKAAISFAHSTLYQNASQKVGQTLNPILARAFQDTDVLAKILARLTIETPPVNDQDELRTSLLSKFVSEDNCDEVLTWAHGWVKQKIDTLLAAKQVASIPYKTFNEAATNYVRVHDRIDILKRFAPRPPREVIDEHLKLARYVRQLRLIDLGIDDLMRAVNDFVQSSVDRTEWASRGYVSPEHLDDFAGDLQAVWSNKLRAIKIIHKAASEIEQGQLLYGQCSEHSMHLQGIHIPDYFLKGSLHALANAPIIGWHPRYPELVDKSNDTTV